MFESTHTTTLLLALWVLVGIVAMLWVSYLIILRRSHSHVIGTRRKTLIAEVLEFWQHVFLAKAESESSGEASSRSARLIRLGVILIALWLLIGTAVFVW